MSGSNEELSILNQEQMLSKIIKDLYFGNGKPALILRVAGIEEQLAVLKETLDKQEKWQSNVNRLMVGTLLSSLGGAILVIIEMIKR